jgi:hypothetical protein
LPEPDPEFLPDYPQEWDTQLDEYEHLAPEEIAGLLDQDWQQDAVPQVEDIEEMLAEQLAPYEEAFNYVQSSEAELRGQDAVAEFVDRYEAAHNAEVDPGAVLERADELIGTMKAPELQREMEYVANQIAATDPQRADEVVAHLQTQEGAALVQQYGPAAAFSMLFNPQAFAEAMLTTAAQELAPGPRSGNAVHDVLAKYYGPSPEQRMAQHEGRPQPPSGGPKAVLAKYYGRS